MGELHHLRDEECMLRGKIIAASAIESAIQLYEASVCSQDQQLKRDLGLAFSLEARVLDYLRAIDKHAEEQARHSVCVIIGMIHARDSDAMNMRLG